MKRICLTVFLLLLFISANAETADAGYESAGILAKCPSFHTFYDAPSPLLAGEAVSVYRALHPDTELNSRDIYALIFASGEYTEACEAEPCEPLDAVTGIESAVYQPDGSLTLSIRTMIDWGSGYEFGFLADITVNPADGRVIKVFIPE